ncbi:hypothetical protein Ddc_19039 [Ditylenchus destructor]|nr:hypothetical protein Ddc_19039 [Ditylenchus destructor]
MSASLFLLINILLSLYCHSSGIEFVEKYGPTGIEFEKSKTVRHPIWYMHYLPKGGQGTTSHISYDPIKGEPVYLMVSIGEYYKVPLSELVKKNIKGAKALQDEIKENVNKHAITDPFTIFTQGK